MHAVIQQCDRNPLLRVTKGTRATDEAVADDVMHR